MDSFRDMAIQNYTRRLTAVILNLVQPEVETFDSNRRPASCKQNAYAKASQLETAAVENIFNQMLAPRL